MDAHNDKTGEPATPSAPMKKQRKRIFTKGSKGSENTVAPPLPPREPSASGPKPTRLSTVPTKPNMFSDIDMMGFPGVAPYRRANDFAVTAEGFVPLCEKEYDIISTNQPYFAKNVSKSTWMYYCTMSLYAGMITLKQERGDSSYEEDTFAGQILSGNHTLPAPIDAYIKALGNVADTSSLRYHLQTPVWPNETADFGRISESTHWKYKSMPSPQICKQRIQEDLRVTATPGVRDWNLPETLCPTKQGAGLPTMNCLGWAATLTNDQVAFIESANIMEDNFPTKFGRFQYNVDLYEKVSLALTKTEDKIKLNP